MAFNGICCLCLGVFLDPYSIKNLNPKPEILSVRGTQPPKATYDGEDPRMEPEGAIASKAPNNQRV